MKVPNDVRCHVCKKIFCCSECRHKHEIKTHAITPIISSSGKSSNVTKYLFCPICEEKPVVLRSQMNPEILEHIKHSHLPLKCEKCSKLFSRIEDLMEFSKCFHSQSSCHSRKSENEPMLKVISIENSNIRTIQANISTQTSPLLSRENSDSRCMTPITKLNLRWKTKSKVHEGFIGDSVSSIKNISSINNSSLITSRSTGICKGKLVRSTSTPLQSELFISKSNDQAFNTSTSGHVSSIYNIGVDSEGSNPLLGIQARTPSKQTLDVNRPRKIGNLVKMSAVTPLRHVMSKSIQKAFAEHGLSKAKQCTGESNDNSFLELPMHSNRAALPLDLRLSPALRRSNSEPTPDSNACITDLNEVYKTQMRRKILLSSKKTTTESIVITSSTQHMSSLDLVKNSNGVNSFNIEKPDILSSKCDQQSVSDSSGTSLYQTCSSVKIIHTSTELNSLNIQESHTYPNEKNAQVQPLVPVHPGALKIASNKYVDNTPTTRIKGAVIKEKLIKFDTPQMEEHSSTELQKEHSFDNLSHTQKEHFSDDVFFTPESTPLRNTRLKNLSPEEHARGIVKCQIQQNHNRMCDHHKRNENVCAQTLVFDRIESISEDDSNIGSDEVFSFEDPGRRPYEKKERIPTSNANSLWSFMSSAIMRIPSFKGEQCTKQSERNEFSGLEACSKSIFKRCASIAGSIVRSKPFVAEESLNSLKRKRTYTIDNQYNKNTWKTNCAEPASAFGSDFVTNISSKRFRIQARKPIERFRINS